MDQFASESIISERVIVAGTLTPLTLFIDGRLQWWHDGVEKYLILEKVALGVLAEGSRIAIKHAVDGGSGYNCCSSRRGTKKTKNFIFEPCSEESRKLWYQKLNDYLDSLGRPKRLFILVNPFGGHKSALQILSNTVRPMLDDAGVEYTVQETKYQLHAKDVAYGLDLTKYEGIVCVSGDGILVEVVNGLLQRQDWRAAIRMPIGVVPAGTGNGMAKSLLDLVGEPCSAYNAVLSIIRGHKLSLDVATISQGDTKYFSVLTLIWGLVADIDIESEKLRWMGSARMDVYAIQRILRLRKYHGHIHFVPAPGFENHFDQTSQIAEPIQEMQFGNRSEEDSKSQEHGYRGPDMDVEDMNWRTMEGPFVLVWLHNVPWASENAMPAPDAKFSDGYLDLVVIRDCPKLALLSSITNLSSGGHVKSPIVTYLKVKAFILEPGQRTNDPSKGGIIDVDGEVLARGNGPDVDKHRYLMAYDKVQVKVDRGLATLFSPI